MQRRATRLQVPITSLLSYARFGHTETLIEVVILEEFVGDIAALIAPGLLVQLSGEISIIRPQRFPRKWLAASSASRTMAGHCPEFHKRIFPLFQTLKSRDASIGVHGRKQIATIGQFVTKCFTSDTSRGMVRSASGFAAPPDKMRAPRIARASRWRGHDRPPPCPLSHGRLHLGSVHLAVR